MTTLIETRIRPRIKQPAAVGIIWNGSADATVAEGGSIDTTITIDPNGTTRDAPVSIDMKVLTSTEYNEQDFAEPQASRANGAFSTGFTDLVEDAADLAGVGYLFVADGWVRLTMPVGIDEFIWARGTTDDPTEQGDKRVAYKLFNQSAGTIGTGIISTVIEDGDVAPPAGGAPAYIKLADGDDALAVGAAPGTMIGEVEVYDADDIKLTITDIDFASGGNLDSRFALSGDDLVAGLTTVSFIYDPVLNTPQMFYFPVLTVTTAGGSITATVTVRPIYPAINPTGHGAGPTVVASSISQFATLLGQTGDGVQILVDPNLQGAQRGGGGKNLVRSNVTWRGHARFALNHGNGVIFKHGNNIIVMDMAFRIGAHQALLAVNGMDVDNGMASYKGASNLYDVLFINCSFSSSNDELFRVKGGGQNTGNRYFAHNIRFSYCIFGEPLYDANHKKGPDHNLGPAISPKNVNIVFDHCLFLGPINRMPMANRSVGVSVINCVIGPSWWATLSRGGSQLNQGEVGAGNEILSVCMENNLYDYGADANRRPNAINLQFLSNPDTAHVYLSGNHFVNQATDTFTDDLLEVGDGVQLFIGPPASVAGVVKATRPFERASDPPNTLPTGTEAQRRALWADVVNNAGVRLRDGNDDVIAGDASLNSYDRDIVNAYRSTGLIRKANVTPGDMDGWYDDDWNGPGSLGHGVAEIL